MKHLSEQETHDLASAYALGALAQPDAESFEQHLADGCDVCRELLRDFEAVVGEMGFSAPGVTPSPNVRERLMRAIRNEKTDRSPVKAVPYQSTPQSVTIRAEEGQWTPLCEGVATKQLFLDQVRNTVSFLIKMSPGSEIPNHHHFGIEECMMIEGEVFSGDETLRAGDYQVNMAGTIHESIGTVNGALFMIIRPQQ